VATQIIYGDVQVTQIRVYSIVPHFDTRRLPKRHRNEFDSSLGKGLRNAMAVGEIAY
jgi:hypothetical protein